MRLNRYTPFPFEIHGIQNLFLHPVNLNGSGYFEETVGKRRFAVIDMGDDAKIPDSGSVIHDYT
jgi:hypothetical protein